MSSKEESLIRKKIATWIRKQNGVAIVTSGSIKTAQGTPDILATVWGHRSYRWITHAIEVKTLVGEPSQLQVATLNEMSRKGWVTSLPTSVDEFKKIHAYYDKLIQNNFDHATAMFLISGHFGDEYGIWSM